MILSMFKEANGQYSMRRVLSFIFALAGVSGGIISTLFQSDWKIVCASFGVPGILALAMLILTTVSDIKEIVSAVKELK